MSEAFRLSGRLPGTSGRVLRFTFDGISYSGRDGDTLASALLANGVHLVGRSYKYHRPRGILSAGAEEPNALIGIRRGPGRFTPNLRATQIELVDGLVAESQNRWPSLTTDFGEINDLAGRFLSAGFYYKTLMGPKAAGSRLWTKVFEPIVRQAAGLGNRPTEADPDRYAQFYDHYDVLVCGGGPAGVAAALAAGTAGRDVLLCDEQSEIGGALLHETTATIDGLPARRWLANARDRLEAMSNVRLMPRTQAFGYYTQNFVALSERVADHQPEHGPVRERLWQVRADEVVLATGAIERPLVFPGNDRPGVMLAEAARVYLNRYGVKVGSRIVIATAHDSAYRVALDLKAAGVGVIAIADMRADPSRESDAARQNDIRIVPKATVVGTRGRLRIASVGIAQVDGADAVGATEWLDVDCLLMSGGWTPSVHLYSQSRGKVAWDADRQMFLPGASVQAERSAGACRGAFGLGEALADGARAGTQAAGGPGAPPTYKVTGDPSQSGGVLGALPRGSMHMGKAFVDFQNDVKVDDIELAVQEGMRSIEHVKRYTTSGMATDQGKTSNLNALAIAARKLGKPVPEVGLTTFRQPYTPVTFGAFAGSNRGDLFDPVRTTPIHLWAAGNGAVFEDVGLWKRAWYFPRAGEDMHAAVQRECRQTRACAGIFDASTLGKIEVVGPDAAAFLELLYTNAWSRLDSGRCRYGLMLNEAGFVMDDGVVARLAADRFHVTTTTGGAARVLHHMEDYLQTEFPHLEVWLTSTTEQWAVIAVQGPRARDIVGALVAGFDISNDRMPHMSIREGRVCGVEARVMRVSFTGELGYEINVPSDYGRAVWEAVWSAARKHDAVAYGTEAMHVMRAEKGYIIVGQETDGTVTPDDLGLAWAIGKAKTDFVGRRSLARPDMVASGRKQLVGLLTNDPATVLEEGAQVVTGSGTPARGTPAIGHVTSSYDSPALNRSIALAMVAGGRKRMGETVHVPIPGTTLAAKIVDPVFFDHKGDRIHV